MAFDTISVAELFLEVDFLAPLSPPQRSQLAEESTLCYFTPGSAIVEEGTTGDTFYIIALGEVGVYKTLGGGPLEIARRGTNTFFGEMALLQDDLRSATVRALTDVVAIELNRATFRNLLISNPEIMLTVLQEISSRLRQTDQRMIEQLLRKNDELERAYRGIEVSYDATLVALSKALDLRDTCTEGHSVRVSRIAVCIGEQLGLSEGGLIALRRGGLLHDIGKIGVPDSILNKRASLTDGEWELMRQHPTWGATVLEHIEFLEDALPIVRHHHERWDGRGYPDQLEGEQIPLAARIFAVADAYDAITGERPYKAALPPSEALTIIQAERGRHFDPDVVDAFVRAFPLLQAEGNAE